MPQCPKHNVDLTPMKTRYGLRWGCPTRDCTVVQWDGSTSTPADYETRQERMKAHAAFDPLWKRGSGKVFKSRGKAYRWMQDAMGLPPHKAHIGMFDAEQCRRLIECIERMEVPDAPQR